MPFVAWLLAAIFFTLAGEPEAALPGPSAETAWHLAAGRFDGVQPRKTAPPLLPQAKDGTGWALPRTKGSPQSYSMLLEAGVFQLPAIPALEVPRPGPSLQGRYKIEPWQDRKDFALAPMGIFGLALIGWGGLVRSPWLLTLGATLIVVGFIVLTGATL